MSISIKNTDSFRYLGSLIVHDGNTTGDWEVKCRIESAKNNFLFMKNLTLHHGIYLKTRIVFLRACIRSELTYNCQNWVLTTEQSNKVDATWRIFLRTIIRGGFRQKGNADDENCSYLFSNEDIHRISEMCRNNS